MIWSVSTLLRRSGIPTPVCVRKASIVGSFEKSVLSFGESVAPARGGSTSRTTVDLRAETWVSGGAVS
jgi:hypothetical protein